MQIYRLSDELLKPAYNILCQSLLPQPVRPPFGMTYCVIEPLGKTSPHDHYDGEIFLILSGTGKMQILGENRDVSTGDLIVIPNHSEHQLVNLSDSESLRFLSVYWDEPAYRRALSSDFLIYSAPPTPNGKLHVGHLSGPYFSADVARKYLRLRGCSATYVSGADENQTYVPARAKQLNRPQEPLKVAQEYTSQILGILESFSAKPDYFLTPHSDLNYQTFVGEFFSSLVKNGSLLERTSDYPFCEDCGIFVHESSVSGACPHCDEKTNGNGCEACGLYNDCRDLKKPECNICGRSCVLKPSTRMVFPLAKFGNQLRSTLKDKTFNPKMRKYVQRLLDNGLRDITVTYPYPWGISAPGLKGQIIYEWLEMAAAYLYEAKMAQGDYEHFWIKKENKVLLAFGFDNSFFYMTFVPALLWAYDSRIKYPDAFLTNFFFLLDGKKFSTSRNHAIWGDEILAKVKTDVLRLYLAKSRAERMDTNFTMPEFTAFVRNFGVETADSLFQRINKLRDLKKIGRQDEVSQKSRYFLESWNALIHQAEISINPEKMTLNQYSECIFRAVATLEEFVSECEASEEADYRTLMAGIKTVAQLFFPICPELGDLLFSAVSLPVKWSSILDLPVLVEDTRALPDRYFSDQLERLLR